MASVIWRPDALADFDEIVRAMARHSPRAAARFGVRMQATTDRLATFPMSGRMVPEFGDPQVRESIVDAYRVIYLVEDDTVEIAAVWHAARPLRFDR